MVPAARRGTGRHRLFQPRVRHHRGAAAVLRRVGHPRRRPSQGRQRPRCPRPRGRSAVQRRVLQPVPVRRRLAAGAVSGHRPARPATRAASRGGRDADPDRGRASRRPHPARPGLEGAGRAGTAAAARFRHRGERGVGALGHRPPVRRRQGPPARAGDAARDRRRPGDPRLLPAYRRPGPGGLPQQRGSRRIPRPGTDPGAGRASGRRQHRRARLRRGAAGGAGRHCVHHPHPSPGGHRPVPA